MEKKLGKNLFVPFSYHDKQSGKTTDNKKSPHGSRYGKMCIKSITYYTYMTSYLLSNAKYIQHIYVSVRFRVWVSEQHPGYWKSNGYGQMWAMKAGVCIGWSQYVNKVLKYDYLDELLFEFCCSSLLHLQHIHTFVSM